MKIAVISDTHNNSNYLKKALIWLNENKIKYLIHCGDIASPETVEELTQTFQGKIYLVFGNADINRDLTALIIKKVKNTFLFDEFGEVEINKKKIAFCHFPDLARKMADGGKYDIVFYGHTHKPWEEKIGDCFLVNSGTLGGVFYQATFAVYDTTTNKLELKILDRISTEY